MVQVTQDRCAASVEPIWVGWRQLLEFGGFDDFHMFWNLQFTGSSDGTKEKQNMDILLIYKSLATHKHTHTQCLIKGKQI